MAKKKPPNRGNSSGRKGMLTAEAFSKMVELRKKGALDYQLAEVVGIHPQTLCAWKTTYPEFAEALKAAGEKATDGVEAALHRSAMGYTHWEEKIFLTRSGKIKRVPVLKHYAPNPAAMSLWLKARKAGLYKDPRADDPLPVQPKASNVVPFAQFCENAKYPAPFPKQEEMRGFGMEETESRLLLGARGYGKTDYVTVLGTAYRLYEDVMSSEEGTPPKETVLIITKSQERNAAMLEEIAKACEANGVRFEKKTAKCLRVAGLVGKDHSVSALTVGAKSVRGRHPKRIVMDDPVTEDDDSEATRKRVQKLYNELQKLCKNILIIGQPVHKFDLYETLRPLLLKMEVTHGMIPELDHDLAAQRAAGVSEESISASYFLKVISELGMPLEKVKVDLASFPPGGAVAFIDPSFEGGDYTALTIIRSHFDGVAVKGKVWKRAWYDCLDEMVAAMVSCGVTRVCFETNSLGEQPVVLLRDVAPAGMGVVGKKSNGNKHSRIVAAGAFAPLIHLTKDSDRLYIDQVRKYEYGAKNDDAPDSLASALEWIGLIRGKQNA